MWGGGGLQPIRNNCIKRPTPISLYIVVDSSIIFFFEDEELGWTDDGTDDGTDGWKGGPTPTNTNTTGQTDTTDIIMLEMVYMNVKLGCMTTSFPPIESILCFIHFYFFNVGAAESFIMLLKGGVSHCGLAIYIKK
jgi:hypothetical protein